MPNGAKYTNDVNLIRQLLYRWALSDGMLWEYCASHRQLQLLLRHGPLGRYLHIVTTGTRYLSGPLDWQGVNLELLGPEPEERDRWQFKLIDRPAGLEIRFVSIIVAELCRIPRSLLIEESTPPVADA